MPENGDASGRRNGRVQEFEAFGAEVSLKQGHPRDVAAGSRAALNQSLAHGIGAARQDNGDRGGNRLGYLWQPITGSHDHVGFEADQFGDNVAESLEPPLGRPALQDEVLPFHIAEGTQALHERSDEGADGLGSNDLRDRGREQDEADAVDLPRLLCPGGTRRGQEGAADASDERTPLNHRCHLVGALWRHRGRCSISFDVA